MLTFSEGALPEPWGVVISILPSSRFLMNAIKTTRKTMTTSDKENIERKLTHVLDMGQRIIDLYPHITCTERAALLLAMTAATGQVTANMRNVAALLRQNLLDPFRIDYLDYARRIENLHKIWDEDLKGAPIFHNLDKHNLPLTNPLDIALKEDTDYDFDIRISDDDDFNFLDMRVGLMENASLMCGAIDERLSQLGRIMRGIIDDYQKLKADADRQNERLKTLEDNYVEELWEDDRARFVSQVEEYTEVSGDKEKSTYQRFLNRMDRQATDRHDFKTLAELNEWVLNGQRPAAFVVENRDKLTIEDLARHFRYVRCRTLLSRHIESFDLLMPADEAYKDLFVNRASQELAFLLAATIGTYVDFRHYYQYSALQMAMQDLGLVYKASGNGLQMKAYIEKAYLKADEGIKDQKTLTDWTGKLLGSVFGTMDENHLAGNYSLKEFIKLKNYYWLCLSIINKVVQRDLRQLGLAPYLYEEHENTPSINDYRNGNGESIMERLSVLKSVIRGETLLG